MTRPEFRFLVRVDVPFTGHSQSLVTPDNKVAYTNGMTVDEYTRERPGEYEIISEARLDELTAKFYDAQRHGPQPITEEQYWDALECLPPCKWQKVEGVELFHISERIAANLVNWYAQRDARHFQMVDYDEADPAVLAKQVRDALSLS